MIRKSKINSILLLSIWLSLSAVFLAGCEATALQNEHQPAEMQSEDMTESGEAMTETEEPLTEDLSSEELSSENTSDEAGSMAALARQLEEKLAARRRTRRRRRAYLALCRHAFGKDFSFAHSITEDPAAVWEQVLADRRAAANDNHYRDLIHLGRIEDLRFPSVEKSADLLEHRLNVMVNSYEGEWSVYTKDLSNGEEIIVHDRSMRSASVMKLFVMAAVYQAIEDGEIERTSEITSRLASMISVSSNEDANRLLALLGENDFGRGIDKVNQYLYTHGYSRRTHEYNGFQSDAAIMDKHHSNRVTAQDCARLLESIYHRTFGSYTVCSEIEKNMLAQHTRYKIPAGVARAADSVLIGNKTGEMDFVENDVAIVYSPACDYIVCVFSDGWTVKDTALSQIQDLSEEIYRYYNDSSWLLNTVKIPQELMDDGSCLLLQSTPEQTG